MRWLSSGDWNRDLCTMCLMQYPWFSNYTYHPFIQRTHIVVTMDSTIIASSNLNKAMKEMWQASKTSSNLLNFLHIHKILFLTVSHPNKNSVDEGEGSFLVSVSSAMISIACSRQTMIIIVLVIPFGFTNVPLDFKYNNYCWLQVSCISCISCCMCSIIISSVNR